MSETTVHLHFIGKNTAKTWLSGYTHAFVIGDQKVAIREGDQIPLFLARLTVNVNEYNRSGDDKISIKMDIINPVFK